MGMILYRKFAKWKKDVLRLDRRCCKPMSRYRKTPRQKLVNILRNMVNKLDCSDVTFICEDGEHVRASRSLLVATKCPVFKSMLSNGMAESNQSQIALPHVSSDALLTVLTFLYTRQLWERDLEFTNQNASYFSLNWFFIFRVLKAARFFSVAQLEYRIAKRLWRDLPRDIFHTEGTLNLVTERFTLLCSAFVELNFGFTGKVLSMMGRVMIRIMFEHDLDVTHIRNLSYESMRYYLFNTRNTGDDGEEICSSSFREYVKLWQLLTWCIHSTIGMDSSCPEASVLQLVKPSLAASILLHPEKQEEVCVELAGHMSELRLRKFTTRLRIGHFDNLKGMINLACIHPELLISLVEPLGIFSSRELNMVLREQVVQAARRRKRSDGYERKCQWRVINAYGAQLVTDYSLSSGKLAVGNVAMWCHHVYEWKIVQIFERLGVDIQWRAWDPDFSLEVGFLRSVQEGSIQLSRLSESENGWALQLQKGRWDDQVAFFATGKKIRDEQLSRVRISPVETKSGNTRISASVRLKLDRMKNTCSFSFGPDGREHHVVCEGLGTGLLFPAVHVSRYDSESLKGETRIELSNGFEFSEPVEFNNIVVKLRQGLVVDRDEISEDSC